MTLRDRQVQALISSLDLVSDQAPESEWRTTCEALLLELSKGASLRRAWLPAGPIAALAAFLWIEVRQLDTRGWIVIAIATIGTGAHLFVPLPPRFSLAGLIVLLVALGLMASAHLQYYWLLAIAICLAAHFIAVFIHPALGHEHRINSLLAYFGYPVQDYSSAKLSFHDYP